MTVTDAQFSGLSGDVAALEIEVLDNSRLILALPSKEDFDASQMYSVQQFNNINAMLASLQETQNILISYITNLKQSHGALDTLFQTHTGLGVLAFSGAVTGGAH